MRVIRVFTDILSPLGRGRIAYASGINDAGQIAGGYNGASSEYSTLFIRYADGRFRLDDDIWKIDLWDRLILITVLVDKVDTPVSGWRGL